MIGQSRYRTRPRGDRRTRDLGMRVDLSDQLQSHAGRVAAVATRWLAAQRALGLREESRTVERRHHGGAPFPGSTVEPTLTLAPASR